MIFSGDIDDPNQGPELPGVAVTPVKARLLELTREEDPRVAIEAWRFFDTLLDRPCQPILQGLLLRSLETRGYFQNYSAESAHMTSWSDEEDEREKLRGNRLDSTNGNGVDGTPSKQYLSQMQSTKRTINASGPGVTLTIPQIPSRTLAPSNINKIIKAWLQLVPEELKANQEGSPGIVLVHAVSSGYEPYVANAETQITNAFETCQGFEWPLEATWLNQDRETASSDSKPEVDLDQKKFYEGDFMSTILDSVESMIERHYDVNLQLTSIIAKLAVLPHPHVHEYLLNPTIPLAGGHGTPISLSSSTLSPSHSIIPRTLYYSIKKVLNKGRLMAEKVKNLKEKMLICKESLMGSSSNTNSGGLSSKGETESISKALNALAVDDEEARLLDALIILEEFCKELAAIAFVKYQVACVS